MTTIEVVLGDITRQQVDAVVTAANESLLGGGGVDGAVHRAAGPRLAEAGAAVAPCEPGDAKATPAFELDPPVRHIIHTVGPVWEGGGYGEADVLAACYRRSLHVADELHARTVAFPAIATGVYGFPPGDAARIAVGALRSAVTAVEHVLLVAYDEETFGFLTAALQRVTSPEILSVSWGRLDVVGLGVVKDLKVWPGGGREWDWAETGTSHSPGIQVADVEELLAEGADTVVLSQGMEKRLGVPQSTVDRLQARGVTVHVAETTEAVALYNRLRGTTAVGGLFHSTC